MGGDLDLYDDRVQEGISWAMRQWGEALGLTTWTQGDGSESVEGDVGAEIHTILVAAGLRCPETNAMATLATPMEAVAWRARYAVGKTVDTWSLHETEPKWLTSNGSGDYEVQALAVIPTQGEGSGS